MTLTRLPAFLLTTVFILSAIFSLTACGGGGGEDTPPEAGNNKPAISIKRAPSGDYLVQGDNMDGVVGIKVTLTYDSSTMASPTVTEGGLISPGLMAANPNTPGTIVIAVISIAPLTGSGQIALVSFASQTGAAGSLAIADVELVVEQSASEQARPG